MNKQARTTTVKIISITDQRVLTILTNSQERLAARTIAGRLDLTFEVARAAAQRLVRAGLVTSEVVREFESPDSASQSWLFGGATMCVRRRAYYTALVNCRASLASQVL